MIFWFLSCPQLTWKNNTISGVTYLVFGVLHKAFGLNLCGCSMPVQYRFVGQQTDLEQYYNFTGNQWGGGNEAVKHCKWKEVT